MKMLQELLTLTEGQMKRAIEDVIAAAVEDTDISGLNYEQAVEKIVKSAVKADNQSILSGLDKREIESYVKILFQPSDMNEAIVEDDSNEEGTRVLSKTSSVNGVSYMSVLEVETETVKIVDSHQKVHLELPYVTWQQLSRQG